MTTTDQTTASGPHRGNGAAVTRWWRQVSTIASLELRQRLRTTRWKLTLLALFVVIAVIVFGSMYLTVGELGGTYRGWSTNLYAILVAALLFVGIILAPTLASTSINGDRKDATLALIQVTPVSNWQLAVGKLLANWISACTTLVVAAPFLIWAVVEAPYGFGYSIAGLVVVMLLLGCYSAIGLGISAMTARTASSAVLTQATIFGLLLGLPALFGLLLPATSQTHMPVRVHHSYPNGYNEPSVCQAYPSAQSFSHSERIWWLLAPNPFLIAADSVASHDNPESTPGHPGPSAAHFAAGALSSARTGPYIVDQSCPAQGSNDTDFDDSWRAREQHEIADIGRSWYIGLAINLALGALGFLVAARRLRVPAKRLPRGVRIA